MFVWLGMREWVSRRRLSVLMLYFIVSYSQLLSKISSEQYSKRKLFRMSISLVSYHMARWSYLSVTNFTLATLAFFSLLSTSHLRVIAHAASSDTEALWDICRATFPTSFRSFLKYHLYIGFLSLFKFASLPHLGATSLPWFIC